MIDYFNLPGIFQVIEKHYKNRKIYEIPYIDKILIFFSSLLKKKY